METLSENANIFSVFSSEFYFLSAIILLGSSFVISVILFILSNSHLHRIVQEIEKKFGAKKDALDENLDQKKESEGTQSSIYLGRFYTLCFSNIFVFPKRSLKKL